ncbi:MAG: type II toxin-antitoxin system Phd/YefM family antitoxin [Planctomycetes bacterium]|nr:type II toxin-antitoxin system Phd/YefM family antitoxin [Planctomycetota bacterium]
MTKQYSIAEAKDRLPSLVHQVESGVTVELTRRGKPVAVVMSKGDYSRLRRASSGLWKAFEAFRKKVALEGLDIDPDAIWGGIRDRSPGRDVVL